MYIYKNKAFRLEGCVILDLGLGVGREEHVHEREKEDTVLVLPKGSLFLLYSAHALMLYSVFFSRLHSAWWYHMPTH